MSTGNHTLIAFDYAIKYLLRDKSDFSIIEGFISTVLKTQGYSNVKIIAILESESNREEPLQKRSLADLIVEDADHQKYMIEIQRSVYKSFIHKALFNTSRLIVDNLASGSDYSTIKKVFHISLLYFPIGVGSIYHGKTIFHEIETQDQLSFNLKDEETGKEFNAVGIFPEYFLISIPQFNDRLEKDIDDWLYFMKHTEVPKNSRSPYMKQIAEKLHILRMTTEERNAYYAYNAEIITNKGVLEYQREKGQAEGREEKSIEIAKKLLSKNLDIHAISEVTGLSVEQINKL